MIKNIIIGKNSFITEANLKHIKNSIAFSANELISSQIRKEIKTYRKVNLIFNNFYPSKFLNELNFKNYDKFLQLSLKKIITVLNTLPANKINKIIYTSSSGVYGLKESLKDDKIDVYNRELYSSFKLAAEKLVINYCNRNKKDYFIMRIFNTYGNKKDTFSFIEKIIRAKKKGSNIYLINEGLSLRDFIHLEDIGKIYKIFLRQRIKKGIYDLGTGRGFLIRDIVEIIEISKNKLIKINKINEVQNSIADTSKLLSQIGNFKFNDLDQYLKRSINTKIKIKKRIKSYQDKSQLNSKSVVIYGAGYAGQQLYDELIKIHEDVLCFVDDNIKIQNSILKGIPIISYSDILKIKEKTNIKRIYLSIPSINKLKRDKLIKKIKKDFFDVRFLPEKKFLFSDQISINDLNIDEINNILRRKQIKISKLNHFAKKNVLVTGAGGSIGFEICRQLIQQDVKKIIALDKSEIAVFNLKNNVKDRRLHIKLIDINNKKYIEKILQKERVDYMFHAAAYKHVNILENNIFSAVKNNIFATLNLCDLSHKYKIKMVFISTDKAANPKSVLGYSKRYAEKICEFYNQFINKKNLINIVRFGNVFGSSGSAITNFLDQINLDKTINITHKNASRYFMTISEACHLVLRTIKIPSKNKIFVLNMGKSLNILKLAKNLGELKSRINPNYKFLYKITGLKPGEKLHETIIDNKEIKSRLNKDIFFVKSKIDIKINFMENCKKLDLVYRKIDEKRLFRELYKIKKF